jgi:hypothetical protein
MKIATVTTAARMPMERFMARSSRCHASDGERPARAASSMQSF